MRAVLALAPAWLRDGGVFVTMSAAQQEAGVRAVAALGGWEVEVAEQRGAGDDDDDNDDDDIFYLLRRPSLSQGPL
jgi:hypothetical protein